jgi:hypothetical protein
MKPITLYSFLTVLAAGLFGLASCQASSQIQNNDPVYTSISPKATASPTHLRPNPTEAPTIQATPDPVEEQLQNLYNASLKYLADTEEKTWQVARNLGYAPLGGYPSNMCGPLAISILKDAAIVSRSAALHDFWLLNPEEDGTLLQSTFPVDHFEWIHTSISIDKIDYNQIPLRAGDLVYIYSGYQGDYSHVLAVTRVDAEGKAYSVTSNYTKDGFVVEEYLLYNPNDPGVGLFYAWTNPANKKLGLTGFGGLDIWRPTRLPYYADGLP